MPATTTKLCSETLTMIPVNEPVLGGRELEYVSECIQTGWISSAGRFIEEFEDKWAAYCGMKQGVAMSNGTTALHAAVACLELNPGDRIIMPAFTIISCALSVIYNGCIPLLVDCDPETWCMDVEQVKILLEKETKNGSNPVRAIMPVHIYGHPVDMDPVRGLADEYDLVIIEDAAEAHGAEYLTGHQANESKWNRCGGLGHISTFSFYANKLITTGEGGMVLTNDPVYAEKARSFRNLCFRNDRRFFHTELGHNFRMTNLQAAIGLAQLERIDEIVTRKRRIGRMYSERLNEIPGIQLPVEKSWARSVYWMYGVVVDGSTGLNTASLGARLKENDVDTRPFFLGMHEQPVFRNMGLFQNDRFPVTERISRQGLYLPSGLALTESQLDQVCEAVRKILKRKF
ncbi:MAG: DegT/DnrJ/EryC1/StrS family aminotransferase [Desulfatirhabdiaceae bacterium]